MFPRAFLCFVFFLSIQLAKAAEGSPVITVDGQVADSSPVVRGDKATIALSTSFPSGAIFYTLDGSAPDATSTRYSAPFNITTTKIIRALAYSADFSQSAASGPIEVQIAPTFALTVSVPGGGSVILNPTSTNGRYISNSVVQLTAQPVSGWNFLSWSGAVTTADNPLSVTVNSDVNITAIFSGKVQLLTPTHGQLVLNPYSETSDVPFGAKVLVTPVPDPGYYLAAYGSDGTGTANPYTFTMTTPTRTISALFLALPAGKATLSAYTTNAGGTVTVDQRLTICPDDNNCYDAPTTNLYTAGEMAVVIATPQPGYAFIGWSGDASGLENPLAVKIEGTKNIRANFAPGASVTIVTSGGTVTRDPDLPVYPIGSSVTLTATPDAGYTFDSFIGATQITANPFTFQVVPNTVITARFNGVERTPLWTYNTGNSFIPFAADDAGNVYLGAGAANGLPYSIVALDAHGNVRWVRGSNRRPEDIAVDPSGNVVMIGSDGVNHAIRRFTSDNVPAGSNDFYDSITHLLTWGPLSIAPDGAVYLYSLTDTHEVSIYDSVVPAIDAVFASAPHRGITSLSGDYIYYGSWTRPAIAKDGKLFFGAVVDYNVYNNPTASVRTKLYATDIASNILWNRLIDGFGFSGSPVLGQNSVYAAGAKGRLWSFGYDGSLQWSTVAGDRLSTPTIGANGTLYVGSINATHFYAFNPDGSLKWVRTPGTTAYFPAAIGSDGTIYAHDTDSVYALDPNGSRMWQFRNAFSTPIISSNLVLLTSGTALVALPANATGPANSPWPMLDAGPQQAASVHAFIASPNFDMANSFRAVDGFHILLHTSPGATVTISASNDLQTWQPIYTTTTATGDVTYIDNATASPAFYRATAK